jgi:hypothetical protein
MSGSGWMLIFSIDLIFLIRMEQCGMKDFVDSPRLQEFQLISNWSQHFCNFKWSLLFCSHLLMIICLQMPRVWPTHLTFLELDKVESQSSMGGKSVIRSIEQLANGRVDFALFIGMKAGFVGFLSILNC